MRKIPFFIFISLAINFELRSQIMPGNKLIDVPIFDNLDSLESVAISNKNNQNYLFLLIQLQRSREEYQSVFVGKYAKEIYNLGIKEKNIFAQAYGKYLQSRETVSMRNGNLLEAVQNAEDALNKFKTIKDTLGQIYTYFVLFNLEAHYQRNIRLLYQADPRNAKADSSQFKKMDLKNALNYINNAKQLINKFPNAKAEVLYNSSMQYYYYLPFWEKTNPELIKKLYFRAEKIINKYKLPYPYTLLTKGSYANALFLQDSVEKSLKIKIDLFYTITHKESRLKESYLSNICAEASGIRRRDIQKKFIAIAQKNIAEIGIHNIDNHRGFLYSCADYYEINKDYKKVAEIRSEIIEVTKALDLNSKIYDYNLNLNQITIKEKEILEQKNAQINQNLTFLAILFLLSIGIIIYVIVSRNKLKDAYNEIFKLKTSRERFLSIIAHDLRSPVDSYQNLAGTISFLLKRGEYNQMEKIANKIDETGIKLKGMLQNLLNWSYQEQDILTFKPSSFFLKELIDEIITIYKPIAETKGITFEVNISENFEIETDKNFLNTIFRNLIDNAIKYSIPNSVVKIKLEKDKSNLSYIISNSPNVKSQKIETLYKYFNTNISYQPSEEGIGLGMILVKDFTKKLNGSVIFKNENDLISFRIIIPLNI